jgi:hypothetical protein
MTVKEPSSRGAQIPNFRQCNGSQLCRTEADTCLLIRSLSSLTEQVKTIVWHQSQAKVWAAELIIILTLMH